MDPSSGDCLPVPQQQSTLTPQSQSAGVIGVSSSDRSPATGGASSSGTGSSSSSSAAATHGSSAASLSPATGSSSAASASPTPSSTGGASPGPLTSNAAASLQAAFGPALVAAAALGKQQGSAVLQLPVSAMGLTPGDGGVSGIGPGGSGGLLHAHAHGHGHGHGHSAHSHSSHGHSHHGHGHGHGGHGHGHGGHGHGHGHGHGMHSNDRSPFGSSPPPPVASSDPSANECKLIDYRGAKVAAFVVNGETMLCLPQAFELFLKHLVGGLHTVYTKLKRLDITPLVCNVEQVRILRGLGAIQPGVNRCKLLCCKDFDVLYKDCTTASSRPGRPPKRASLLGMSPGHQETLLKLKKSRLENGDYTSYENGHIAAHLLKGLHRAIDPMMLFPLLTGETRMEKSPLLANGYNHPPTHINPLPFMALNHHGHSATAILNPATGVPISSSHSMSSRSDGSIIKERAHVADVLAARLKEEKNDCDRSIMALDHRVRELNQLNGSSNGHSPVLNLSQKSTCAVAGDQSGSDAALNDPCDDDDDNISDVDDDDEKDQDLSDGPDVSCGANGERSAANAAAAAAAAAAYSTLLGETSGGISSIETLLRNIQGLLKVAADNARQQERQINYEKAELKMEILREREIRENLEKQILEEQRIRVLYQKRLKKEKKARRRIQEQLEVEMKRHIQYEEALKNTSAEALRIVNDFPSGRKRSESDIETLSQELQEMDRNNRADAERKLQESRVFCKNQMLFTSTT